MAAAAPAERPDPTGRERNAPEAASVRRTVREIAETFDVAGIVRRITESAVPAAGADGGYVERVDFRTDEVEVMAGSGSGTPPPGTRVPYPGSLAERVIERGAPEIIDDVAAESEVGKGSKFTVMFPERKG